MTDLERAEYDSLQENMNVYMAAQTLRSVGGWWNDQ